MGDQVTAFSVACSHCHRGIMTVPRVSDPEIAALLAHLRICCPPPVPPDRAGLGTILSHFHLTPTRANARAAEPPALRGAPTAGGVAGPVRPRHE